MPDLDTAAFRDRWDETIMIPSVEMYALCAALDTARVELAAAYRERERLIGAANFHALEQQAAELRITNALKCFEEDDFNGVYFALIRGTELTEVKE